MKVYQCNKFCGFQYNLRDKIFLVGQLIKVNDGDDIDNMICRHPHFHKIDDTRYEKIAPTINQIRMVPPAPHLMSREMVMQELQGYGVRFDVYALDKELEFLLQMTRGVSKKTFLTVINEQGQPVYLDNIDKLKLPPDEVHVPKEATVQEQSKKLQDAIKKEEIPIPSVDKYLTNKDKGLPQTVMAIQRDKSEVDKYQENAMNFDEFVRKNTVGDFIVEAERRKEAVLIEFDPSKPAYVPEVITKKEKIKFKDEDLTYDYFRYLIEPKKGVFCTTPITVIDLQELRKVWYNNYTLETYVAFLIGKGENVKELLDNVDETTGGFAGRLFLRSKFEEYNEKCESDREIIAINLLLKREKELDNIDPPFAWGTKYERFRKYLTDVEPYGFHNKFRVGKESTTIPEIKRLVRKVSLLLKIGRNPPETEEEIDRMLIKYGYDKLINKCKQDEVDEEQEKKDKQERIRLKKLEEEKEKQEKIDKIRKEMDDDLLKLLED